MRFLLGLSIVLVLFSGLALALAQAPTALEPAAEQSAEPAAPTFQLATPSPGDRGLYSGGFDDLAFEWLPPRLFLDPYGVWHVDTPLEWRGGQTHNHGPSADEAQILHVGLDGGVLGHTTRQNQSNANAWQGPLHDDAASWSDRTTVTRFQGTAFCGYQSAPGTVQVGDKVVVFGDCFHGENQTTFTVTEIVADQGTPTATLSRQVGDQRVSLTFIQGIPQPVKREVETTNYREVWNLTGYEEGSLDTELPAAPARRTGAVAKPMPMEPYGPDDTGLDLPLLPSEAWAAAQLLEPRFALFLHENPEAYTYIATYLDDPTGGQPLWWFHVAGETGTATIIVTGAPASGPSGLAAAKGMPMHISYTEHTFLTPPPPEAMPQGAPSWATIVAAYHAVSVESKPVNYLGFTAQCARSCDLARVSFVAKNGTYSQEEKEQQVPFTDSTRHSTTTSTGVRFDNTGLAIERSRSEFWSTHESRGPLSPPAPPSPTQAEPGDVHGTTSLPEPTVNGWSAGAKAAGAAGTAGLVAAAWPGFKLILAAFSRIQPAKALEHPVRARMMEAILAEPGLTVQGVSKKVERSPTATRHHLRILERSHIRLVRSGRGVHCFARTAGSQEISQSLATATPGARAVLQAIRDHPGAAAATIARVTNLDASTVTHHSRRLQKAGLIQASRTGRSLVLHAPAAASRSTCPTPTKNSTPIT